MAIPMDGGELGAWKRYAKAAARIFDTYVGRTNGASRRVQKVVRSKQRAWALRAAYAFFNGWSLGREEAEALRSIEAGETDVRMISERTGLDVEKTSNLVNAYAAMKAVLDEARWDRLAEAADSRDAETTWDREALVLIDALKSGERDVIRLAAAYGVHPIHVWILREAYLYDRVLPQEDKAKMAFELLESGEKPKKISRRVKLSAYTVANMRMALRSVKKVLGEPVPRLARRAVKPLSDAEWDDRIRRIMQSGGQVEGVDRRLVNAVKDVAFYAAFGEEALTPAAVKVLSRLQERGTCDVSAWQLAKEFRLSYSTVLIYMRAWQSMQRQGILQSIMAAKWKKPAEAKTAEPYGEPGQSAKPERDWVNKLKEWVGAVESRLVSLEKRVSEIERESRSYLNNESIASVVKELQGAVGTLAAALGAGTASGPHVGEQRGNGGTQLGR